MNIKKNLRIVIVEDNALTLNYIMESFKLEGFVDVISFKTFKDAVFYFSSHKPDISILDINLPDGNGLDLLKMIRKNENLMDLPVIILTAHSNMENKKIAFKNYADIFLPKPIDYEELMLWLNSLLKRKEIYENTHFSRDRFSNKEITIDHKLKIFKYKGKEIVNLTNREFELLYTLIKNSPRIFSRQEIIENIWKTCSVENLVDIHLHNLRKKLPEGLSKKILNVHGKGFRFLL
ncbi:MAG: response regulator transcription factor [Elusimicrobiota bacterium]